MRVTYTAGVWDLLHEGHLLALREAKALGGVLIVGVVSDAGAEAYKRRPVQSEATRLAVVEALEMVDRVILQPTTDPTPVLEMLDAEGLRPAVMTHGADWGRLREGMETLVRMGIEWKLTRYLPGISTTRTIEKVRHAAAAG